MEFSLSDQLTEPIDAPVALMEALTLNDRAEPSESLQMGALVTRTAPVDPQSLGYVYYDSKYVPTGFGLQNNGAICWCNSIIQLMLGLPAMSKTLLECEETLSGNVFAMEYIKLLKCILPNTRNQSGIDKEALRGASISILSAFMARAAQVCKGTKLSLGQECVDEAFTLFIDLLGCPKVENLFNNVYELIIDCKNCEVRASSVRDKSYRIQMFTPVKLTTKERFCTYLRVHPSEFNGSYKCEKCNHVMTKFFREERLRKLSEIVVIIFNKFQTKDNRWFPEELVFNARGGKPALKYKLIGKIEHSGNRHGGHYWAHSYRDDVWQSFNDTSVSVGNGDSSPGTFMVAYHLLAPE